MKRVSYYWVDGEYMTAAKARKLHPEGFCTAHRKTVSVETFGEKAERFLSGLLYYGVITVLCLGVIYLTFKMVTGM